MSFHYDADKVSENAVSREDAELIALNDEVLKSLNVHCTNSVKGKVLFSGFANFIYIISIPVVAFAVFFAEKMDDFIKFPSFILMMFCVAFVIISNEVNTTRSRKNDLFRFNKSLSEFLADKVFMNYYSKTLKVLKKKNVSFSRASEIKNVYMSLAYLYAQNSLIFKSKEDIKRGFDKFKQENVDNAEAGYFRLIFNEYFDKLKVTEFRNNKAVNIYEKKFLESEAKRMNNEAIAAQNRKKASDKKALKEKANLLKNPMNENQEIEKNEDTTLVDGYVDRRYFN